MPTSDQHRNSRLLDEFSQSLRNFLGADNPQRLASKRDEWRPPADIRQNAERYMLEIELPGISRASIRVEVEDRELVIHCERVESDHGDRVIRRERHLGGFTRRFRLPADALERELSARMDNGVLLVKVPRKDQTDVTRARDIDVA